MCAFSASSVYLLSLHLAWLEGHQDDGHIPWPLLAFPPSFLCTCAILSGERLPLPCPAPCRLVSSYSRVQRLAGAASSGNPSPCLADLGFPSISSRQPCPRAACSSHPKP